LSHSAAKNKTVLSASAGAILPCPVGWRIVMATERYLLDSGVESSDITTVRQRILE
jgi:hypothetical protein